METSHHFGWHDFRLTYSKNKLIVGRFFYAKNKVMALALGKDEAAEAHKNVHKISNHLSGQCGLLFTNKPKTYVVE